LKKDSFGENALFKALNFNQEAAVWQLLEVKPFKQLKSRNKENLSALEFSKQKDMTLHYKLKKLVKREHDCMRSLFDRLTNNQYRINSQKWTALKCKCFFGITQALVTLQTALYFLHIDMTYSIFLIAMQYVGCAIYINLLFSDPGYIGKGVRTSNPISCQVAFLAQKTLLDYEEVVRLAKKIKVCVVCKTIVPYRSKHCKEFDRCVLRYDHYCPYIGTVIGQENHVLFLFYLMWFMLVFALYFYLSYRLWLTIYKGDFRYVRNHKIKIVLSVVTGADCVTMALFDVWLFTIHLYLVAVNLTTNEFVNYARYDYLLDDGVFRNSFNRGPCINCLYFWCGFCRMRAGNNLEQDEEALGANAKSVLHSNNR